ncbi:MAG: hypothetical protein A2857_00960 [Candidatus Levybacteria bacterium RIFCSPHIGHO2_01_FULL_36_15]|nr:MAG: hypothetical protein A2857_00960 [Candidatus Levybacteria bacterium RIFCSPHIGHO2_01_FULL_36_15]OGH38349.1 MAG: hypothetical protein A2905_00825 [Candidatus Levybacteria bacterium RIFCSPLOWO2_01_FULL_36_10]
MKKIHSTTQDFTDIVSIDKDMVLFKNGNVCAVLEISPVNFYLLTEEEQEARIYAYMSLLNSLSFYIQILIVSKRIDLSFYLKLIDQKISAEKSPRILEHLKHYKDFIGQLVKGEDLLDKKIYIVIPYSELERGATSQTKTLVTKNPETTALRKANEIIVDKKNQIMTQIQRAGLSSRQLRTEELVKLFYEAFNEESVDIEFQEMDIKNIVI